MKNTAHHLTSTLTSVLTFGIVVLGVAGICYEVFAPNGMLQHWLTKTWDSNPLLVIALGGVLLLAKRWIEALNPAERLANAMVYGAIACGLFVIIHGAVAG